MDKNLALELVRVTEAAALGAALWVGKGDEKQADQAAVENMRKTFNSVDFDGTVVIGEGERDEAPMLYIGERVGNGKGMKVDVAVDPLEGTTITAKGMPNAISVAAAAPQGCLLHAPDTYMDKIAVGPKAVGAIRLEDTPTENLHRISEKIGKAMDELTVVMMDRDRHKELIAEVRKCGCRIRLIGDGDVAGGISTAIPESGIDVLMGIGGGPEGVITAVALKALGGEIQGRLKPRNEEERKRARDMGIDDVDKLLKMEDLAKGNEGIFAATGVTDGTMLKGVIYTPTGALTESVVMRCKTGTIRHMRTMHRFNKYPEY